MSTTLPSPPFIAIPGIHNFRDISDGTSGARSGLIYRSADPSKATPAGLDKMSKELGITTIFDLRSTSEIKRDGPEWAGVEVSSPDDAFAAHHLTRFWTPVFADQDYSPEQIALRYKDYARGGTAGFVAAYRQILKAAPKAYAKILRFVVAQKGKGEGEREGCLVHCTAGKDRTGCIVAILLLLAGVEKEIVAEEYALTELGLADLRPLFVERLLKHPALEGNKDKALNMTGSKKETMLATIEMIEAEFGGPEVYVTKDCGLSEQELEKLKTVLRSS